MIDLMMLPLAALPFPDIDPVIVQIGPLAIHWYGVGYVVGILFAWWYGRRLVTNPRLWPEGVKPMRPEDIDDFLVWAAIGVVLGGRVGYILFYDFARYLANPLDIFAVWQGGMSFHGGFAGVTIAMILFARSRGIGIWTLFDVISAGVPVGLGLVRVTNFINAELWGRPTDAPSGVIFCNDRLRELGGGQCIAGEFARHPSQLYEAALEGLVLFLAMRLLTHTFLRLKNPGCVSGTFLAGYGMSRIFVEFFREPDAHIGYLAGGWLTMGMVLSAPMVLFGLWAILRSRSQTAQSARA
ncbi:prolipoprotein diacylglyceryl transferase [Mesorhizobium sp. ZMM04-5]|uniref:Phosphatidylglycerol--prolipoprotein diacylglyceryl transferase n=1 Tax=Mesorhizobium marinum TaxID=3228790 RepID=A0ABV3QU67_9HYPH